jgi:hypothetical protein
MKLVDNTMKLSPKRMKLVDNTAKVSAIHHFITEWRGYENYQTTYEMCNNVMKTMKQGMKYAQQNMKLINKGMKYVTML